MAVAEGLVKDYPAISSYQMLLARSLAECGGSAKEMGRTEEAIAYFRQAQAAWQKVVDDNPAQYAAFVDLASCHDRLGWTLFGLGRKEQALEELEAARAILQRLLDKYPRNVLRRGRDTLANVLINMVEAQRSLGRLVEARATCDQAIAIRELVIKEFPQVLQNRIRMGECLCDRDKSRVAAGDSRARWPIGAPRSRPTRSCRVASAMVNPRCSRPAVTRCWPLSRAAPARESLVPNVPRRRKPRWGSCAGSSKAAIAISDSSMSPPCIRFVPGPDFRLLMMDVAFPADPFVVGR